MNGLNKFSKSLEPFVEKIQALSKTQKILICCATFFVLVGAFVYFLYLPKFEEIDKLRTEYKKLEAKLDSAKKQAKQLEKYQQKMREAEANFKIAKKALPEKKEIALLLKDIEKVGQESGLDISLFKPESEIRKDFYAEIPLSMQVTGGYHNLALFFDKIARLHRIVNVKSIKMTSKKGGDKLSISCTATAYQFVETPPKDKKKKKKKKRR